MSELINLVAKRGRVKAALTRFISYFNNIALDREPVNHITELGIRLNKAEQIWSDFHDIQDRIETLDSSPGQLEERDKFENLYFEISATVNDFISLHSIPEDNNSNRSGTRSRRSSALSSTSHPTIRTPRNTPGDGDRPLPPYTLSDRPPLASGALPPPHTALPHNPGTPHPAGHPSYPCSGNYCQPCTSSRAHWGGVPPLKLPAIGLPTFSGAYHDWLPFYDVFTSLVDRNEHLSDVQKLHYLKSCLQGEAATILKSIELVATNYKIALNSLIDRYHNINTIIQRHIKDLFNLPKVQEKSSSSLQRLLDDSQKNVRALRVLNQPVQFWDSVLVHLLTSKFDLDTYHKWEDIWSGRLASFEDVCEFLEHRCRVLQACSTFDKLLITPSSKPDKKSQSASKNDRMANHCDKVSNSYVTTQGNTCPACKGSHHISACPSFLTKEIDGRYETLKSLGLCFNCLRPFHTTRQCRSSKCRSCGQSHNSLLHVDKDSESSDSIAPPNVEHSPCDNSSQNNAVSLVNVNSEEFEHPPQVLLSTAVIHITDHHGNRITCRALLDCASHVSFVTSALANLLGQTQQEISQPVKGIGSSSVNISKYIVTQISSLNSDYKTTTRFLVLSQITDYLPSIRMDMSRIKIPAHIKLADPDYFCPAKIDVLIGGDLFWDLMDKGHMKIAGGSLHLQNTRFGWIIGGQVSKPRNNSSLVCGVTTLDDISEQIQKFWTVEEVSSGRRFAGNDQKCEEEYLDTTHRADTGRYVVSLPFKKDPSLLGESKSIATKRFLSLEKRLNRNPGLKPQYVAFIEEYLRLHHMESLDDTDATSAFNYLPHHAVVKENSTTTKVRVVFDASCPTSSGLSLNDVLMVGPVVQQELFPILTRFRTHRYVITADVEKMYRQIEVEPDQTNLQCILWRDCEQDPIRSYRLCTVTYGTSCAPYLATRTLLKLAEDERDQFLIASEVSRRDFYVDDFLSGGTDITQVKELVRQMTEMLKRGGFHLRKWCSNQPSLLQELPQQDLSFEDHDFNHNAVVKMLGLMWNPTQDNFHWEINPRPECCSKRMMVSATAQIFDPLGLIGPVIVQAKMLLQRLWSHQLGWDDPVPVPMQLEWDKYSKSLEELNRICVPRLMIVDSPIHHYVLHGFSDASEGAYGACIYIKSIDPAGNIDIHLVASKSRVAPLKKLTLPRLELCGALLLTELMDNVSRAIEIPLTDHKYYTDSTIVLGWICSPSTHWQTFVGNRVAKIQELSSPSEWNHVAGHENPADLLSRGTSAETLTTSDLWWLGPSYLHTASDPQPTHGESIPMEDLPERRTNVTLTVCASFIKDRSLISHYSSLRTLINVVAFCLRYINNLRIEKSKRPSTRLLTVKERKIALIHILQLVQRDAFPQEYTSLQNNQSVAANSKLRSLNCFMDPDQLIRVGGRLNLSSDLKPDQKNPVVLPSSSLFTRLMVLHEHKNNLHAGPQLLLSIIRQTYWPINGLRIIKKVLKTCITCFRLTAQMSHQIMGDLPEQRVTPARPFFTTGVDYCGPFQTRLSRKRGITVTKSYICVFVCFRTKAVHIELVEDLTAEAFIAALRRFIARRGKPHTIFSDNGTNFCKANSELKELHSLLSSDHHRQNVTSLMSDQGIHWEFIPPQSPHFGGLWEGAVKSTKYHLRRCVGHAKLTYCELNTMLTQVEATLNSRPLTPISQNPDDFQSLTPAHFLIGDSLVAAPDTDLQAVNVNHLSHWQLVQQLYQHFWTRWSREYLSNLQQRTRWQTNSKNLRIGQLVILKEDGIPPLQWRLARVIQLHPGRDNKIRVVTLRTPTGTLKRTITKVCPLPEDEDGLQDTSGPVLD